MLIVESKSMKDKSVLKQLDTKTYFNNGLDIVDTPNWLIKADFSRTHRDLIAISPEGEKITFLDYFSNFDLPSIVTKNQLLLRGNLLEILAGPLAPGQYAQASGDGALSIGEVSSLSGTAKAIRLDGNEFVLSNGDPVFQGDTIEVSDSGAVGLTFVDKTTLSLSEGGKMVLDELVYDSESGTGSMKLDMLKGVFSFTSGEIANIGPDAMSLETPVVTCGIRGTTVAGKAAVEGNENSFTLLQDADGGVGEISVSNAGGTQVLGQVGATTSIASFNAPPPPPIILSAAQIQANYGTALNILPPTPTIAPTPQEAPPPQEQQQEEAQEEASEESDEEAEEASEEVSGEEEGSEEGEEELAEEEGPTEEELAEAEEGLPEEDIAAVSEEGAPVEEGVPAGEEVAAVEEGAPPPEEGPPEGDEQAAREAFDTALAAGASPEQAMAEAAAAGGFDEPGARGPAPDGGPLGGEPGGAPLGGDALGGPIPGAPATDPLGGAPFAQTFAPGVGGPILGSPLGPGPMNAGQGPVMGPAFGPALMDTMGGGPMMGGPMMGGPMGINDPLGGPGGFGGEPIFGMMGPEPYGPAEVGPTETYFFEDPALYDDFKSNETVVSSEQKLTGIIGSSSNDTLTGTNENDTIHGLLGDDTINGGVGIDTMNGGLGNDTYIVDNTNDIVNENINEGTDTVQSSVTYQLANNLENLTLTGSSNINGVGNGLNNIIIGNTGTNELSGGLGNDIFYFNGTSSFGDTIKDFSTSDELRFNLTFDVPTSQYSVTRSHFYEHNSSSRLTYNSQSNSNELPYVFNFTKDTSSYLTKSFKSDVVSSIRYTKATSGNGTENIFIVGDGTHSAIWLWDDKSQGYGVSNSELTFIAELENFDNDTLSASNIVLNTI